MRSYLSVTISTPNNMSQVLLDSAWNHQESILPDLTYWVGFIPFPLKFVWTNWIIIWFPSHHSIFFDLWQFRSCRGMDPSAKVKLAIQVQIPSNLFFGNFSMILPLNLLQTDLLSHSVALKAHWKIPLLNSLAKIKEPLLSLKKMLMKCSLAPGEKNS